MPRMLLIKKLNTIEIAKRIGAQLIRFPVNFRSVSDAVFTTTARARYCTPTSELPVFQKTIFLLLLILLRCSWSSFLGLGGLNYVPVAYENGSTDQIKVINAVTTAVFGWMVLYISGVIYYNAKIQPQYVDQRLKHIIQRP